MSDGGGAAGTFDLAAGSGVAGIRQASDGGGAAGVVPSLSIEPLYFFLTWPARFRSGSLIAKKKFRMKG
jgi:hypothetical protein